MDEPMDQDLTVGQDFRIEDLRESIANSERFKAEACGDLFNTWENLHNSGHIANVEAQLNIVIERYEDLQQLQRYLDYKRLATVYNRKIYNKFLVPIWVAVTNEDMTVGYILYPRLTPLTEVLQGINLLNGQEREDKLGKVLRLCFAPIALAIDSLHTPLDHIRGIYYHRDVCINNVFMSVRSRVDDEGEEYDDARLKLTGWPQLNHYHHHPELREGGVQYLKRHDWYSFGVYILEVLRLLFTPDVNFPAIQNYADVEDLRHAITVLGLEEALIGHLLRYIVIAVNCMTLRNDAQLPVDRYQVPEHEVPQDGMPEVLKGRNTLRFDYRVSPWTAELLWRYEATRPDAFTAYQHRADGECICQSCLINFTGYDPTREYVEETFVGGRPRCKHMRKFHCASCYTNGERQFCTEKRGTTSTMLGHCDSYALILYGDVCARERGGQPVHRFQHDAYMIANAMRHRLICGMPEKHIYVRPVYGNANVEGNAANLLGMHCQDMCERIHSDDASCEVDSPYTVFIFYSGYGHAEAAGGWRTSPDQNITIAREAISNHLEAIRSCLRGSECKTQCVEIDCIIDSCNSAADNSAQRVTDLPFPATVYTHVRSNYPPASRDTNNAYTVTHWLCQLLRSLFHTRCCNPRCDDCLAGSMCDVHRCQGDLRAVVQAGRTSVCKKMKEHISEEHYDCFIDGECLRVHQGHCVTNCQYPARVHVDSKSDSEYLLLAYFNPRGVRLKCFPLDPVQPHLAMCTLEIDFGSEMTVEGVRTEIVNQLRGEGNYEWIQLTLLTNMTDGYSEYELVTDDRLNYIIGSSALFYHVITEPVEVTLIGYRANGEKILEILKMDINASDLDRMGVDGIKVSHVLPNLFVHVTHHLRYPLLNNGNQKPEDTAPLRKSFKRRLTVGRDYNDWDCVEEKARSYWLDGDTGRFKVSRGSGAAISIEWEIDE